MPPVCVLPDDMQLKAILPVSMLPKRMLPKNELPVSVLPVDMLPKGVPPVQYTMSRRYPASIFQHFT